MPKFHACPDRFDFTTSVSAREANWSDAQYGIFGVGEVTEPGALRPFEIFRHFALAEPPQQAGYGPVRVDEDKRSAVTHQRSSDRSGEPYKVADITAVDQLRTRYEAFDQASAKHKTDRRARKSRTRG